MSASTRAESPPTGVAPTSPARPGFPPAQIRLRDALVVALTVLTGATDAIAFTRLGNVFTSVMTGNMVLLGMGIGRGELVTLAHTGLALASFIAGTVAGAHIAGVHRPGDGVWPRRLTVTLGVELGFFVAVAIAWWASHSHPTGATQSVLLAASALGLGMQSSGILRLGVSGLSTTYLTGTLTTVVQSVTTTRSLRSSGRSLCVLSALILGAALGAVLALRAPVLAPLVAPVILITVIAVARLRLGG